MPEIAYFFRAVYLRKVELKALERSKISKGSLLSINRDLVTSRPAGRYVSKRAGLVIKSMHPFTVGK